MQMNSELSVFMGSCDVKCIIYQFVTSISISCRTSDHIENCYSIECWPMFLEMKLMELLLRLIEFRWEFKESEKAKRAAFIWNTKNVDFEEI